MNAPVPYRSDLDGLRAVAVLAVIGFHAAPGWAPGGFAGVDVFFVVSGFLITSLVVAQVASGRFTFAGFYARRVRRLFPALTLVLAVVLVAGVCLLDAGAVRALGRHVVAGATFVPNLLSWKESAYFSPAAAITPLLHLWSLGVEEQFYLLWPVLAVSLSGTPRVRFGVAVALVVVSLGLAIDRAATHPAEAFYLLHTRLWEPMIGAALALVPAALRAPRLVRSAGAWAGVAAILAAVVHLDGSAPYPSLWALLPTVGTALVIAGGPDAAPNRTVLSARPLVGVGLISYPLYLWHWPLLSFGALLGATSRLQTTALVLVSFALAVATWAWIERPVRTTGARRRGTAAGLVALTGAVAAAGAGVWALAPQPTGMEAAERRVEEARALDRELTLPHRGDSCQRPGVTPRARAVCEVGGDPDGAGLLVVWGDSHADAWSNVYNTIGEAHHMRVVVFAHSGCPPLLGVRNSDGPGGRSEACVTPGLGEEVLASIRALKPERVVVVAHWSLYANGWTQSGYPMPETHFVTRAASGPGDQATSRAAIASSLPETVAALRTFTQVTIQRAWPQLKHPVVEGLAEPGKDYEPTVAEHRAREVFTDGVIDAIVAQDPGVIVVDPSPAVCTDRCRAVDADQLMYVDDNHPTVAATLRARALLEQGLPRAGPPTSP